MVPPPPKVGYTPQLSRSDHEPQRLPPRDRVTRIPLGVAALVAPAALVSGAFILAGVNIDAGAGEQTFGFALTFAVFFGTFYVAPALFERFLRADRRLGPASVRAGESQRPSSSNI